MKSNASNGFPALATPYGFQVITHTCSEGDIIRLVTGNFIKMVSVVSVPTIGQPLELMLMYNAQDTVLGPVGNKWRTNYMMNLTFSGSPTVNQATFTDNSGRAFGFVLSGSVWVQDTASYFIAATLTNPGPGWLLTFPDNSAFAFDSSGNLTSQVDPHGNTTTLTYTSGKLTSIAEPTGRTITLAYTGSLITTITDPRGKTTTLVYDTGNDNLTQVMGPEGCTITYSYATPSNHLLTGRTDANSHSFSYVYDSTPRLVQVTDAESPANSITYRYSNVTDGSDYYQLQRTLLTDALGQEWEYRFDQAGMMWRTIDPLGHVMHYTWDPQQKLLYGAGPYQPLNDADGFHPDNPLDMFRRFGYDTQGNLLYRADASGMITAYTYDAHSRLTSVTPGQAHMGMQGHWPGHYGSDGAHFFAYQTSGADLSSLPSYVSSVTTSGATSTHYDDNTHGTTLMDPRAPFGIGAPTLTRGMGYIGVGSSGVQSFTVTIHMASSHSFNLSIYSWEVDNLYAASPLTYVAFSGCDMTYTVSYWNGASTVTKSFRVYNNAPGIWVTFPVQGDASHPVTLTVASTSDSGYPRISGLAFDPYANRTTSYTYNTYGDLLTVTDPQGDVTTMTYNSDGTMATFQDARNHTWTLSYLDSYKNLTKIQDPNTPTAGITYLTYDNNGNVLTVQDPNSHTWTWTYDGKNRVKTVTDPLSNVTTNDYDGAGNLLSVEDANSNTTQFFYTATNRLKKVLDAAGNQTLIVYDAAGHPLTLTDALNRETALAYDAAGRMVATTRPDGSLVSQVLDGLDRLRALTSPNGNVPNPSNINLTNAANLLRNAGAEQADYSTANQAMQWTPSTSGASNIRDASTAHSGNASLKFATSTSAGYWAQGKLSLPVGITAAAWHWARNDGGANAANVWDSVLLFGFNGSSIEAAGSSTTLPASSTTWTQTAVNRFTLPGDTYAVREGYGTYRANAQAASGTPSVWQDDMNLVSLSTAISYDAEGRLSKTQTPDGAQQQLIRDHFGRVSQVVDPRGFVTTLVYDSLDRIVSVTDPLGNVTQYSWDAVSNLVSFIDPSSHQTQYQYDNLNRLVTITYPDTTTETFSYDAASNLATYTNNRGQERTFSYDNANRLTLVTYNTDSTTVAFGYDSVGNVLSRTERNLDKVLFFYDVLYRVIAVQREVHGSNTTPGWDQQSQYDAVGNRIEFDNGPSGAIFDVSDYDVGDFAGETTLWSVPSGGIDSMNRLLKFNDASGNQTQFAYDVEGRVTTITFPNGVTTSAAYDVVGHLLSLTSTHSATTVLSLGYGYDAASNRIGQVTATDTFDYRIDSAGRLVEESINWFAERSVDRFQNGSLSLTELSTGAIALLPFAESMSAASINVDRWRMGFQSPNSVDYLGLAVCQQNSLQFCFPLGFQDNAPYPVGDYGTNSNLVWAGAEHRSQLSGDFDVQVDFKNFQGRPESTSSSTATGLGLMVHDTHIETSVGAPVNRVFINRDNYPSYRAQIHSAGTSVVDSRSASTTDVSGKYRIVRSGSTVTAYYWNGSSWTSQGTYASFTTNPLYLSLTHQTQNAVGTGAFANLVLNSGSTAYPTSGTYQSGVYDSGRSVTWNSIQWQATTPGTSNVSFQIAVSSSSSGPWTFVGPDGTSGTFFTASGTSIHAGTTGRYARYQASLTGDGTVTPSISRVDVLFSGSNTSTEIAYVFDGSGNMTSRVQEISGSATITETRTYNSLNQLTQNVIVNGPNAGTWTFQYDYSGNCIHKKNTTTGVSTVYHWDEDGRLLEVELSTGGGAEYGAGHYGTDHYEVISPITTTVSYVYDRPGRMLTRKLSTDTNPSSYAWDGPNCVMETDPSGNVTRYYTVRSGLWGLDRTVSSVTSTYQVHFDALGSVRKVTDSTGTVIGTFDTDAWGNPLSTTSDSVPNGGLMYRWIGAAGVRYDAATGLYYMRRRWYDAQTGRFLSRDPIAMASLVTAAQSDPPSFVAMSLAFSGVSMVNLYCYAQNQPTLLIDPSGLKVVIDPSADPADAQKIQWLINALRSTPTGERLYEALDEQPTVYVIRRKGVSNAGVGQTNYGTVRCPVEGNLYLKNHKVYIDLDFGGAAHLGQQLLFVLAHELGHAYEVTFHTNDSEWGRYLASIGSNYGPGNNTSPNEAYAIGNWENPIRLEYSQLTGFPYHPRPIY